MNRVYPRCPQCEGKECTDISCKFSGRKHEDAAPQVADGRASGKPLIDNALASGETGSLAVAAPDIGYECAWPK